jgi:hypothetical protein
VRRSSLAAMPAMSTGSSEPAHPRAGAGYRWAFSRA